MRTFEDKHEQESAGDSSVPTWLGRTLSEMGCEINHRRTNRTEEGRPDEGFD